VHFMTLGFLKIVLCLCRQSVYVTLCNNKYVNDVILIRQYYTVKSVVLNHSWLTIIGVLETLDYVYGDSCNKIS
jgi:hypothetical protein